MPPSDAKPKPPTNPANPGPARGAAYLYHQQEPEAKPVSPRRNLPSRKPKSKPEAQAGQKYFLNNLKTFGYVLAGMALISVLAFVVAKQVNRVQLRKNKERIEEYNIQMNLGQNEALAGISRKPGAEGSNTTVTASAPVGKTMQIERMRKALYLYELGKARMKEQNHDAAVVRFQESLELNPYLHKAWADLGDCYLRLNDASKAQIALERAVEGDPTNAEVLCNLGVAHLSLNEPAKARELFEQAMAVNPTYARSHFQLGKLHIQLRDYDQAMLSLERYLRMDPTDAEALRARAFIEAQRKQYNQSMENLKKAIAERPDWAELYWDAAACSALLGRAEDAIRYLEKGEGFTSVGDAHKAWRAPAFDQLRSSAAGQIYEKELVDRYRRNQQNPL